MTAVWLVWTDTGSGNACILFFVGERRFVQPQPGDDLAAIAARELPGVEDGLERLASWNLHLLARATSRGAVLPSDVVFVEPPPAR